LTSTTTVSTVRRVSSSTASLGNRIRAARLAADLDQRALAERAGASERTIGRWENNVTMPGGDDIAQLALVLAVPVGWLLTGEDS
jgi:transcriptional regulator with XRE-family HTH domain